MNASEYLRSKEWSMGNGQCPECYGVPPSWLGHPSYLDSSSIGHKPNCALAAALRETSTDPVVMMGGFHSDRVYECYWTPSGFLSTRLKEGEEHPIISDRTIELCEYNPVTADASYGGRAEGDCPNEASVCLGKDPSWHLCESCAALPRFKRFRRRVPLRRAEHPSAEQT